MNEAHATPPPSQTMFSMITGYWVSQAIGAVAAQGDAFDRHAHAPQLGV